MEDDIIKKFWWNFYQNYHYEFNLIAKLKNVVIKTKLFNEDSFRIIIKINIS